MIATDMHKPFRMAAPALRFTRWWLTVGIMCAAAGGLCRGAEPDALQAFTRDAHLERFDGDRDGTFDERETTALRSAFGGIDVPMLPQKPYDYAQVKRPKYLQPSELDSADNTPEDNPLTNAGAALGRVLFYDTQLSRNNTLSCATCHPQQAAFSDPRRFSVGFAGGRTQRNSMGLANIRYTNVKRGRPGFFWDERAATLEEQVLMPIQDEVEMGMQLDELVARLQKLPYYPALFEAAFGTPQVTRERIAKALAQFLRSLESWDSKFDRAAAAAEKLSVDFADFSAEENLGKSLFIDGLEGITEFACAMCHVPPTFNMEQAQNIGLELESKDRGLGALDRESNDPFTPSNDGKFKASSLRNIALTAPYMHDGRFKTLEEVVEHYSGGVHPHPNLGLAVAEQTGDKPTLGIQFTKQQQAALVAFLKTLTDKRFITDRRFSDPFLRAEK